MGPPSTPASSVPLGNTSTDGTCPRRYLAKGCVPSRPPQCPSFSFAIDMDQLMPSTMPHWRKLMGVASIFYLLGATLFIVKAFEALPSPFAFLGVGLIAIGLYFNVRAMAEMRR